ncbi:GumC family protein [Devosia submarina]|uniref:GumC family protein n=1 Tax=Devosia submarina TaxID=1173082 RepID=UPI000D340C4D|nr:hypothetical protein [Devosia submarina]
MKNELFLLRYYWSLLLRYPLRWLVPMLAVIAIGGYVVMQEPRSYVSVARVATQSPPVTGSLVQSTVPSEQLQSLEQRVFSRENLVALAQRLGQFTDGAGLTDAQIAEAMRRQINLQVTPTNPNNPASNSALMTVRFEAATAEGAARGASEVIGMLVAGNRDTRMLEAGEVRAFLEQEVLKRQQQANNARREMNVFVAQNEALLPSRLVMYTSEVQELQQELQTIQLAMATLAADGRVIETQLALASRSASGENSQLAALRLELSNKQTIYSPSHPDIISLRSRIGTLEAAMARPDAHEPAPSPRAMTTDGISAALLSERVVAVQEQRAEYEARRARINERLVALRGTIAEMPGVESEFLALQRRYTLAEENLADMQRRLDTALVGERLEDAQVNSQISVIDKPDVPVYPAGSGRVRSMLIVAALGVAAGLGTLLGLDVLGGKINSKRALEPILEGGALVLIPDWKPRRAWLGGVGLVALVALMEPGASVFSLAGFVTLTG